VALWLIVAWKLYKRWVERSADTELPWAGAGREWAAGLAFGVLLFSAMTGVVALLGGLTVTGVGGVGDLAAMVAMAAISGVGEELLFRGVILRQLEKMVGTWGGLALTSAFLASRIWAMRGRRGLRPSPSRWRRDCCWARPIC
jgi:membrane protease YdiL (CAAX protease family)